jgi:hypothetical protein
MLAAKSEGEKDRDKTGNEKPGVYFSTPLVLWTLFFYKFPVYSLTSYADLNEVHAGY